MSFRRTPVQPPSQGKTDAKSFPAPTKGWVSSQNLAAAKPGTAVLLENFFPTQTSVRVRRGSTKYATIGSGAVISMMAFQGGAVEALFACSATSIFDISAPADPDTPPSAAVSSLNDGYFSFQNFETAGGNFMYAVNDSTSDKALLFDGSTWTPIDDLSTPAITGVTTALLSHVWVYRNRLFFIEKSTMRAWALPVASLGGAAISIDLAGIMQKGGALLLGDTWSMDAGDGLDDKCVFLSDKGEIAIYQGGDPADPNDWSLVGRYDGSPPLGKRATMRAGGDLIIATKQGAIPVSMAVAKDPAALSLSAVSRPIQPDWVRDAAARSGLPWEIAKWPTENMALVSTPVVDSSTPAWCYVVNLETGAWAKYTGWDTRCFAVFGDAVYFGTNDGRVLQAEEGGSDDGSIYVSKCAFSFDHLGSVGVEKTIVSARATFLASADFLPQLSVSTDYAVSFPGAPNAAAVTTGSLWDEAVWDLDVWDGAGAVEPIPTRWVSIGQSGAAIAPQIQISNGSVGIPDAELVIMDLLFETGELMI